MIRGGDEIFFQRHRHLGSVLMRSKLFVKCRFITNQKGGLKVKYYNFKNCYFPQEKNFGNHKFVKLLIGIKHKIHCLDGFLMMQRFKWGACLCHFNDS